MAFALALPARAQAPDPQTADEQLFAAVNDYRVSLGLPLLKRDVRLDAAARGHAEDLAAHNLTGHIGSDGKRGGDRAKAQGYPVQRWSEAVNAGSGTVALTLSDWQRSPGHDAILRTGLAHAGAGVAWRAGSRHGYYWVLLAASGAPAPVSPPEPLPVPSLPPLLPVRSDPCPDLTALLRNVEDALARLREAIERMAP
jgi:uncharacterized protein YkwD